MSEEPREKFDRLRARYLAARAAHDARRSELAVIAGSRDPAIGAKRVVDK